MSENVISQGDASRQYCIFDPTGNITALVETPVPVDHQPAVAAALMAQHPEVEQLGFVRFAEAGRNEDALQAELRMAGGEFCGNAAMSAAALYLLRRGQGTEGEACVRLRVSGAAQPVTVRLCRESDDSFRAAVQMPPAREIGERELAFGGRSGTLLLVRMQGISHLLIEPGSVFFALKEDRSAAAEVVAVWCEALSAESLGLMFLEKDEEGFILTPLVYVPGCGTVFWETACASGSSAVGMALAAQTGAAADLCLRQPGGALRVESDPASGETWLYGRTRLLMERKAE